jgi:DNA-directed RNA polymerase subunit RPC12/RpoP
MATYQCSKCGMAVNASCANCNEPLLNDVLTKDDGSTVQVSKCPKCEGKIKSPLCCGADMSCSV